MDKCPLDLESRRPVQPVKVPFTIRQIDTIS